MSALSVSVAEGPNAITKIITLSGEMDESSLEGAKPQIDNLLTDSATKKFILDLRPLEFINSKGIGYLVFMHTHLSKDQRELILTGANEAVMDVISLVGLTTIIRYFETVEEALKNV